MSLQCNVRNISSRSFVVVVCLFCTTSEFLFFIFLRTPVNDLGVKKSDVIFSLRYNLSSVPMPAG